MRQLMVRILGIFALSLLVSAPCWAYQTENVVIVVIDGVRDTEFFGDPDHEYIPRIWNDLKPKGTVYENFFNSSQTSTTSGHAVITSGVELYLPIRYRNGTEYNIVQWAPSIFEYYRRELHTPRDKTWIINGKGAQMGLTGQSRHPAYGPAYGPKVSFYPKGVEAPAVWKEFQYVMDTYRPSLVMVNFSDPDEHAHRGSWESYVEAIRVVDDYVFRIFDKLRNDPHYASTTTLIITSDHGRHEDGVLNGFVGHGDHCGGCRAVPFLALGPDIYQNRVLSKTGSLADIAPTVGELLGFRTYLSEGRVLREMFKDPPPTRGAEAIRPSLAVAGRRMHKVFMARTSGPWEVYYRQSGDGGLTWSDPLTLSTSGRRVSDPVVAAEGLGVVTAWSSYASGVWRAVVRISHDGGATWSDEKVIQPWSSEVGAHIAPAVTINNGVVDLLVNAFYSHISHYVIAEGTVTEAAPLEGFHMKAPSFWTDGSVIHAAFYQMDYTDRNWEVYYARKVGDVWTIPTRISVSPGDSIDPSIAVDDAAIHLAWADNSTGHQEILYRRSLDGLSWSPATKLVTGAVSAWKPRFLDTPGRLVLVWEDYREGRPAIYSKSSSDGGETWSDEEAVSPGMKFCTAPAIAADELGAVSIAWQQYRKQKDIWTINISEMPVVTQP